MIPTQYIIIACWIIFGLYWFISAGSVKSTQVTKGGLAGNWHSIWLLIGGLFLSNFRFLAKVGVSFSLLTILLIPHSIVVNVVIIVFAVTGLIVQSFAEGQRSVLHSVGDWQGLGEKANLRSFECAHEESSEEVEHELTLRLG